MLPITNSAFVTSSARFVQIIINCLFLLFQFWFYLSLSFCMLLPLILFLPQFPPLFDLYFCLNCASIFASISASNASMPASSSVSIPPPILPLFRLYFAVTSASISASISVIISPGIPFDLSLLCFKLQLTTFLQ